MKRMILATAAACLMVPIANGGAAIANPGDEWRKQFEIRAECDKKLTEAKSRREFHKELRECRKKLCVERKRHTGVTKFPHAIYRIEPPSEPNLDDAFPERPNVRNDVDVSGAGSFGHRLRRFKAIQSAIAIGNGVTSQSTTKAIPKSMTRPRQAIEEPHKTGIRSNAKLPSAHMGT